MPLVPHVSSGQIVASTWGNLVADHVVMRFTTAAQRSSQLTAPVLNQLTMLDSAPGVVQYWTGTAWATLSIQLLYTAPLFSGVVGTSASKLAEVLIPSIAYPYRATVLVNSQVVPGPSANSVFMNIRYNTAGTAGVVGDTLVRSMRGTGVVAQLNGTAQIDRPAGGPLAVAAWANIDGGSNLAYANDPTLNQLHVTITPT